MSSAEEFGPDITPIKEEIENTPSVVIFKKFRVKGKAALRDLVEAKDDSFTKTINKTDYVLNFVEPLYIDEIFLYTENEDKSINSKVKIKVFETFSNKEIKFKCQESEGDQHFYSIGKVCSKLIIEGTTSGYIVGKAKIKKINIIGYKPSDIESIENAAQFIRYESNETVKYCELKISETKEKLAELDGIIEQKEIR